MQRKSIIQDVLSLAELYRPTWPAINATIERTGAPTMHVAEGSLRERLKEIQAAVSSARNEHAACRQAMDQARADLARLDCSPREMTGTSEWRAAEQAKSQLEDADAKVKQLEAAQVGLLEMLGEKGNRASADRNGPRSGEHGGGWHAFAAGLDLPRGVNRVDGELADLITPAMAAGLTVKPGSGLTAPTQFRQEITEMARDERHLFMVFPGEQAEDSDLGVSDYRQTGERTVTGDVERDPISTDAKAQLNIEVTAETLPLKQVAVVLEHVPVKLVEALDTFEAFLQNEMAFQLRLALDAHVAAALAASEPVKGETGDDLIAKIRYGVEAARAAGAKPSVLAVAPAVATTLDLVKTDLGYIFAIRDVGGSSPLFGLTVVEVPGLAKPVLIDPVTAGVLYLGTARLFADPYTGLATNELRLRLEAETLMWVRDVHGLYVLDKPAK